MGIEPTTDALQSHPCTQKNNQEGKNIKKKYKEFFTLIAKRYSWNVTTFVERHEDFKEAIQLHDREIIFKGIGIFI